MHWPNLTDLLEGIPWAVVGAVATRLYMPERATRDLDIVVLAADAHRTFQRLAEAGFSQRGDLAIGGSSWEAPDGTPVDVMAGHEEWWATALAEAPGNRDAQDLPVLPLAYLVLMKLLASRLQDIADVARMLGGAREPDLAQVRAVVAQYAPDLAQDLESLITLGKLEAGGT